MGSVKNVKWIPLDVDALDDPKIMALVSALGMEGYGTYIMLIQYLAKQEPNYTLTIDFLKHLARRNSVSEEKVKAVVMSFGLFESQDDLFYSNSLIKRMEHYDNLRVINRKKAEKMWDKKHRAAAQLIVTESDKNQLTELTVNKEHNAAALPEHSRCYARREEKRRIDKNRIDKNIEDNKSESKDSDTPLLISDVKILYDKIIEYFDEDLRPKNNKQKLDWCNTLDKLMRIDGKTPELIIHVIKETRKDEFWSKNFLSVMKLRRLDKDKVQNFLKFEKLFPGRKTEEIQDYSTPQEFKK